MRNIIILAGVFFSTITLASKPNTKLTTCLSSREYITTFKFLRSQKELQLSEKQITSTADQVSKGCSGSSQNFIKIMKLLTKMGIDSGSSLKTALSFVSKDESHTKAFIEIFRQTYDPKFLDLDALSALKISIKLSAEYKGEVTKALKDFQELVQYCLKNKTMELPNVQCAKIATEVTMLGQRFNEEVASPFVDLMYFLQEDKKGPLLDKNNSLDIAKFIFKFGPIAQKNFKQAYLFAVSKKGLSSSTQMAIVFAKEMATRSFKNNPI